MSSRWLVLCARLLELTRNARAAARRCDRSLVLVAAACLAPVVACSSPDQASEAPQASPTRTVSAATSPSATEYAVFPSGEPAAGWTLSEAVHLTGAGAKAQAVIDPDLDWFAEYDGPSEDPNRQPYLNVSGYTVSLETFKQGRVQPSIGLSEGEIAGRRALFAAQPDGPDEFSMVAIAFGADYTITLSAEGVPLEDLRRIATTLRPASRSEWVGAGGEVVDCMPMQEGCTRQ